MTQTHAIKVAILDDYERAVASHPAIAALAGQVELTCFDRPLGSLEQAAAALSGFDAVCLIRERMAFPAALFERLPGLKYLAFTGARNPSCDHQAAAAHGVQVSNTAGGPSKASTAELTWALALAAAKRLTRAEAGLRAGHWRGDARQRDYPLPQMLEGKTLGLLGVGEIGQRVAAFGKAFGMTTIAWSPNLTDARAADAGVERVNKADLFARADVLSLHMVLADSTRGIVGANDLAQMRAGSILVNTSRAGLIDSAALVAAMVAAPDRTVALDVFDTEPLSAADPLHALLELPNAVLCPHLGYVNEPVFEAFAQGLAEVIAAWARGEPVRVINA